MRYLHLDGVGQRIRERLLALGYRRPDGLPDVGRFIREHGYDARNFYPWVNKNRTPTGATLLRLSADLQCPVGELLLGESEMDKRKAPKKAAGRRRKLARVVAFCAVLLGGGVPARGGTLDDVQVVERVSLIGRWRRALGRGLARPLLPLPCLA